MQRFVQRELEMGDGNRMYTHSEPQQLKWWRVVASGGVRQCLEAGRVVIGPQLDRESTGPKEGNCLHNLHNLIFVLVLAHAPHD